MKSVLTLLGTFLLLNATAQPDGGQTTAPAETTKSLALEYYYHKDYSKALETIKPILEGNEADDQTFSIAGNIYEALEQPKEADKIYKRGIKKFSNSGFLLNKYGELLSARGDENAIKQWEKGIETVPDYSGNYYNASKFYSLKNPVWSIIYGEMFLNIEMLTGRTAEIKSLVLESYRQLLSDPDLSKNNKDRAGFEQAYLASMSKQSEVVSSGIHPESLMMIRTRFVLDWFQHHSGKFPFRLFEHHRQLLKQGLFEAYNQWIFGVAHNLQSYQNWTSTHTEEYNAFNSFQQSQPVKFSSKQYYK